MSAGELTQPKTGNAVTATNAASMPASAFEGRSISARFQ